MTLTEKFAALTPEQQEQFDTVKTVEQFEALLAEHKLEPSAEEKAGALEYLEKGIIPLADEELENAAGGLLKFFPPKLPIFK